MGKTPTAYRPCAGVMLFNAQGRVFVAQRIDNPGPAWQMPQGGVDKGEDPRETAVRELGEEIGVAPDQVEIVAEHPEWLRYDLPADLIGKLWKGKYRGQRQKWYCARFLGTDADIDIETPHPEFSAWRWAAIETLPDLIVPFKRDLYAQIVAAFAPVIAEHIDIR